MELIERTNQFNTTTRRRTGRSPTVDGRPRCSLVCSASLRDRFGSLGVVAVAIFDQDVRVFDSVITICRAMGFGPGFALLRTVMDAAGPAPFRGLFVPSDRNGRAAELFAQAGIRSETDGVWTLPSGAAGPQTPTWLTRD